MQNDNEDSHDGSSSYEKLENSEHGEGSTHEEVQYNDGNVGSLEKFRNSKGGDNIQKTDEDGHDEGNPQQTQNSEEGEKDSPQDNHDKSRGSEHDSPQEEKHHNSNENSEQCIKLGDEGGSSVKDQVEQILVMKPPLSPQRSQENVLAASPRQGAMIHS